MRVVRSRPLAHEFVGAAPAPSVSAGMGGAMTSPYMSASQQSLGAGAGGEAGDRGDTGAAAGGAVGARGHSPSAGASSGSGAALRALLQDEERGMNATVYVLLRAVDRFHAQTQR
jgi:hypothetical protein